MKFLIALCFLIGAGSAQGAQNCYVEKTLPSMGTFIHIKWVQSCDEKLSPTHWTEIQALLNNLEAELSLYQKNSGIRRLNRDKLLKVSSHDFKELINISHRAYSKTRGYFNIGVLPALEIMKTRGSGFDGYGLRERERLLEAMAMPRKSPVEGNEIHLRNKKMKVTLDGVAKGYAVDKVADRLQLWGKRNWFINFSGNIRAHGNAIRGQGWQVVVRNLDTSRTKNLTLMNQSLSTSSGEHNYFSADRKWHHVIDPIKLQPASRPTVSVVGPKASTCDLLSTAFLSMPEVMARKVLRDEYEGYFIVNME